VFTGIVEEVGRIRSVRPEGEGRVLEIEARGVLAGVRPGDSIAVDGVCQTVVEIGEDSFDVVAIGTTLERTTFGSFTPGRRVNLERALRMGDRLGGHLVQGHVDTTGEVTRVEPREEKVLIDFTTPPVVGDVTVLHGSIALNGISLTVNALPAEGVAQVSIIPYTLEHTAIGDLEPGDAVNLEGDLIGKYVRQLLGRPDRAGSPELLRAWGYAPAGPPQSTR
jgi:riboflavin synthase